MQIIESHTTLQSEVFVGAIPRIFQAKGTWKGSQMIYLIAKIAVDPQTKQKAKKIIICSPSRRLTRFFQATPRERNSCGKKGDQKKGESNGRNGGGPEQPTYIHS